MHRRAHEVPNASPVRCADQAPNAAPVQGAHELSNEDADGLSNEGTLEFDDVVDHEVANRVPFGANICAHEGTNNCVSKGLVSTQHPFKRAHDMPEMYRRNVH